PVIWLTTISCTWVLADILAITAAAACRGLIANGSPTLNITGTSTMTASNGTAIDLTGLNLGVSLVSANASNSTTGIRLNTTTGSFIVTGVGTTAGSGGTISNMSVNGAE